MSYRAKQRIAIGILTVVLPGCMRSQAPAAAQPDSAQTAPAATPATTGQAHNDTYVVGNDDVLSINVWKEAELSRVVPVRSDGKISLPLVGEIQSAGRTPLQLEQDIAEKLKSFITTPQVTVIVQEIKSQQFNVLGMVVKPGSYSIALAPTVMDAIALAGGFKDFAKEKGVYILRQTPGGGQTRISFNYKDFIKGKNASQNPKLEPHDTIVVP